MGVIHRGDSPITMLNKLFGLFSKDPVAEPSVRYGAGIGTHFESTYAQ